MKACPTCANIIQNDDDSVLDSFPTKRAERIRKVIRYNLEKCGVISVSLRETFASSFICDICETRGSGSYHRIIEV